MRGLIQIISGWTWFTSTFLAIIAKTTDIVDDSIGVIAGLIGIAAGIVLLVTSIIKRKQAKIDLEISQIQLKRLKEELDEI